MSKHDYWLQSVHLDDAPVATTQAEIDAYTNENVPFLIQGGTSVDPLYVKYVTRTPPGIASDSYVTVCPTVSSKPPTVHVVGSDAHVLGLRNARIICLAESDVTARDQSKVLMYMGRLLAKDKARGTLYGKAVGKFYGTSKGQCRNDSEAFTFGHSMVKLYHQARVHVCEESSHLWIKDYRGGKVSLDYVGGS